MLRDVLISAKRSGGRCESSISEGLAAHNKHVPIGSCSHRYSHNRRDGELLSGSKDAGDRLFESKMVVERCRS